MSLPGFQICDACVDSNCVDMTGCQQRTNTKYTDPAIAGQPQYALISFVPAGYNADTATKLYKLSTMCKANREASHEMHLLAQRLERQKLFAVCKVRAVAFNEDEAKQLARDIIKNVDSLHTVYTVRVGHPFPIHADIRGLAEDRDCVALQQDMEHGLYEARKKACKAQQQEIREVKERLEMYKAECDKETVDAQPGSMEEYIQVRYRYATQQMALKQLKEETEVVQDKCNNTRAFIENTLKNSPHQSTYMHVLQEKIGPICDDLTKYLKEYI